MTVENGPAGVRRRDRVRTRTALLDAAAEVFARRGFTAATLDEIAEAAGFTRGAFYHHFDSKEQLFLAVIARRDQELLARYEPIAEVSLPPDTHATALQWQQLHEDDGIETRLRLEMRLLALRNDELRDDLVDVERAAIVATAERLAEAALKHGSSWRHRPDLIAALIHLMSSALRTRAALGETDTLELMETFLGLVWEGSLDPSALTTSPSTSTSTA